MRIAFLYLILINLLDFGTTAILIEKFGFWIEGNPILTYSMVHANSMYPILIHKFVPLFILAAGLWIMLKYYPDRYQLPIWKWIVWTMNIALTGIVIRSAYIIYNT